MRGSNSIQQVNKKKVENCSSEYFGVFWNTQKGKWHARMTVEYQQIHIGYFDDDREAAKAYLQAAKKQWGKDIRLADQKLLGIGNS